VPDVQVRLEWCENDLAGEAMKLCLECAGIKVALSPVRLGSPRHGVYVEVLASQARRARRQLRPLLEERARRAAGAPDAGGRGDAPAIEVTCEGCGQTGRFPPAQRGSVQECPHCGAFVDVEGRAGSRESEGAPEGAGEPPGS
jgi:hypothetical protein